jgi:hypothetical protein
MKNKTEIREERLGIVRRWEASGLSQRKFSAQENISYQNLNNWVKIFRKQNTELPKAGFIKIAVAENNISQETIFSEITFANGNRIKFYNAVDISQLKKLAS